MVRGGEERFFRLAMGLVPVKIKDREGKIISEKIDIKHRTALNYEMYICKEYLHGMLHSTFQKLDHVEKLKWYLFEEMERERERISNEEEISKMKEKQERNK